MYLFRYNVGCIMYNIYKGIYRCSIPGIVKNFARIPSDQELARINAFFNYVCSHVRPCPLLGISFGAALAKVENIFQ